MFDVGFWEILLILILALLVIGPERLPGAARKAGFFIGKARRYIEGVRSEVESELDVSEFKRMLHNQEVQINELQQQLKAGADNIGADVKSGVETDQKNDIMSDVPSHSFHEREEDDDDDETSYGDEDVSTEKKPVENNSAKKQPAAINASEKTADAPSSQKEKG